MLHLEDSDVALSVSSDDCHWSSGYNGQHLSGGHPSNDITSASVVPSRPLPTLLQHSHSMHPDYEVPAGFMTETEVYQQFLQQGIRTDRYGFVEQQQQQQPPPPLQQQQHRSVPSTPRATSFSPSLLFPRASAHVQPPSSSMQGSPPASAATAPCTAPTATTPSKSLASSGLLGPGAREARANQRRLRKWLQMLGPHGEHLGQYMAMHPGKFKERVRKGIPEELRGLCWQLLSGGRLLQSANPGVYLALQEHVEVDTDTAIMRDLNRTFPQHVFFMYRQGPGQRALYNVLRAYAAYDHKVGYVQGMGFIAAVLLLQMGEEESFWTLVALMKGPPLQQQEQLEKRTERFGSDAPITPSAGAGAHPFASGRRLHGSGSAPSTPAPGGAPSPQQQPHMQQPQPPPPIRPHRRNHSLRSNGVTTAPSTPTVSAAVPPQHPFAQGTPFSCRPPTPQSPPTQQPQAACAAPPPACLPCLRCTSCGRAFGTAPAYVPASPPAAATLPPNHAHLASFAERCAQASTATAANALRGRVAPVCHGGPHAVLQGGAACALIPEPCSSADRAAHGSSGGSNGSSGGSGHGSGGGDHGSGGAAVMERSVKDQQHLSWSAAAEGLSSAYSMPHLDQDGAQAAAMGASALGGPIEGRGQAGGGASGGGRALRHMLSGGCASQTSDSLSGSSMDPLYASASQVSEQSLPSTPQPSVSVGPQQQGSYHSRSTSLPLSPTNHAATAPVAPAATQPPPHETEPTQGGAPSSHTRPLPASRGGLLAPPAAASDGKVSCTDGATPSAAAAAATAVRDWTLQGLLVTSQPSLVRPDQLPAQKPPSRPSRFRGTHLQLSGSDAGSAAHTPGQSAAAPSPCCSGVQDDAGGGGLACAPPNPAPCAPLPPTQPGRQPARSRPSSGQVAGGQCVLLDEVPAALCDECAQASGGGSEAGGERPSEQQCSVSRSGSGSGSGVSLDCSSGSNSQPPRLYPLSLGDSRLARVAGAMMHPGQRYPLGSMYVAGMPLLQQSLFQLQGLIKDEVPRLAKLFATEGLEVAMFSTCWFNTIFAYCLPFSHLLRIWDIFMLEGMKIVFRTGIVLLKAAEKRLVRTGNVDDIVESLGAKNVHTLLPAPSTMIKMALKIKVSKRLADLQQQWVERRKAQGLAG